MDQRPGIVRSYASPKLLGFFVIGGSVWAVIFLIGYGLYSWVT